MNGKQFYDAVMDRLGKRNSIELRNAVIVETEQAVDSLQRASWSPWFLFEDNVVNMPAGLRRFDTELRLINVDEEFPVFSWAPSSEVYPLWRLLERREAYRLQRREAEILGDEPLFWSRAPDNQHNFVLDVFPAPAEEGKLRIQAFVYELSPQDSQEEIDNKWLLHASRWLMAEVCAIMAQQYLQNSEQSVGFQVEEQREREAHWRKSNAMVIAQQNFVKGSD